MRKLPDTVLIGVVDQWWEHARWRPPHDPEVIEASKQRRAAVLQSKSKPKRYTDRLRERLNEKRKK